MNKTSLAVFAVLIVFLVVAVLFGGGWGMMVPGMLWWGFGPFVTLLIPVGFLWAVLWFFWKTGTKPPASTCPNCGYEKLAGSRYCSHCGKPLT